MVHITDDELTVLIEAAKRDVADAFAYDRPHDQRRACELTVSVLLELRDLRTVARWAKWHLREALEGRIDRLSIEGIVSALGREGIVVSGEEGERHE